MPYSHLIINFCTDRSPYALAYRLSAKDPAAAIYCADYKSPARIAHIGPTTKIYIAAHGDGTDYLKSESSFSKSPHVTAWHYKEFCQILADLFADIRIKPKNFNTKTPRPTISLLICFAGMHNLAQKIHFELANKGLFVNIHARRSVVSLSKQSGKKATSKLALNGRILFYCEKYRHTKDQKEKKDYVQILKPMLKNKIHQQPLSKITVIWEKSSTNTLYQTVYDSYSLKKFNQGEIERKPDFYKKTKYKNLEKSFHPEEKIPGLTTEKNIEIFISRLTTKIDLLSKEINQAHSGIMSMFSSAKQKQIEERSYLVRLSTALKYRETPPTDYSIKSANLYSQAVHLLASTKAGCINMDA